jgi:hypothetical protein
MTPFGACGDEPCLTVCSNTHRYVTVTRPGILTSPLGNWCADYDPQSTQRLFIPARHQLARFRQLSTATRLAFSLACYDTRGTPVFIAASDLPADAMPAQPTTGTSFLRVNRPNTPSISRLIPVPPITSFPEYIAALPPWQTDLLQGIFQANELDRLCQHLLAGTSLLMCSDGGAKQHTGSFGWVVATANKLLWECSGRATGWFANSFRSEGIGQLALLVFLEAFATYFQLLDVPLHHCSSSDPWIRIATDNQGLIQRITPELAAPTVFAGAGLTAEYDVVHEIVEITRRLPFPLVWEHVKGHQDDVRQWYELTPMETLNVRADAHATAALEAHLHPSKSHMIPSSKVALRIDAIDITSHYATHLRKAATRPAMIQRCHKHPACAKSCW